MNYYYDTAIKEVRLALLEQLSILIDKRLTVCRLKASHIMYNFGTVAMGVVAVQIISLVSTFFLFRVYFPNILSQLLVKEPPLGAYAYNVITLQVGYDVYIKISLARFRQFDRSDCVLYDQKYLLSADVSGQCRLTKSATFR